MQVNELDKIIIRDLLTRGRIGISDLERSASQDILVNAVLFTDTRKAGATDSIEDCVNYSTVAKQICAMAEKNQKKTVEAFAADIAEMCLSHPLVQKVIIRAEKTSAVRFTKSVGVEIEREK